LPVFLLEKQWALVFDYATTEIRAYGISKLGTFENRDGRMERLFWVQGRLEELAQTANYDANKLARLCGISVRQLQRYFRRRFQHSPQNWLDDLRMLAAQKLLLSGDSVKKVAIELGFKHTSHFCRQFKYRNNMTPSEFTTLQVTKCRSRITNVADR
jgi:AraC-like DNA-binding protein